jgi:hypothetical protein
MSRSIKFNFSINRLLYEGEGICDAAETHAPELDPRLPAGYTAETRALITTVTGGDTAQKSVAGMVGTLTQEQNTRLQTLQDILGAAKKTAKRAFAGQDVKLHDAFQVGAKLPGDLAGILQRARIVLASCQDAANATALAAKGWLAPDTQALSDAIEALDVTDDTQETAKANKKGTTADRNRAANDLYEHLLTIQNAANLQWPARGNAHVAVREKFRLGTFPPKTKDQGTSDIPAHLGATPGAAGSGEILFNWDDVRRAVGYRLQLFDVRGVMVFNEIVVPSEHRVTGLTVGMEIIASVTSRNAAGEESQPSAAITVTVP